MIDPFDLFSTSSLNLASVIPTMVSRLLTSAITSVIASAAGVTASAAVASAAGVSAVASVAAGAAGASGAETPHAVIERTVAAAKIVAIIFFFIP